eukprot:177780_1
MTEEQNIQRIFQLKAKFKAQTEYNKLEQEAARMVGRNEKVCFDVCSLDDNQKEIARFRSWHAERWLRKSSVSQSAKNKVKKALRIRKEGSVSHIDNSYSGNIFEAHVAGDSGIYNTSITLDKDTCNGTRDFNSTRDIINTYCSSKYCEDDRCSHVGALAFSLLDKSPLQSKMKSNKYAPFTNAADEFIMGDIFLSKERMPPAKLFSHPATAFLGTEYDIVAWTSHKFGWRAAALCFMYACGGSISYYAPVCNDKNCDKRMKWNDTLFKWQCRGTNKLGRDHFSSHVLFANEEDAPFFYGIVRVKDLGKFVKFSLYLHDGSTTIQQASRYCGINRQKAYEWALKIRLATGEFKTFFDIKLGDKGSTLEMDGKYFGQEHKNRQMAKPKGYRKKGVCWRVMERDFTVKGRKRRLSFLVESENVNECGELLITHCPYGVTVHVHSFSFCSCS